MEIDGSLPYSQHPTTGPYPGPVTITWRVLRLWMEETASRYGK